MDKGIKDGGTTLLLRSREPVVNVGESKTIASQCRAVDRRVTRSAHRTAGVIEGTGGISGNSNMRGR